MTHEAPARHGTTARIEEPDDRYRILGLPLPWFAVLLVIVLAATVTGAAEPGMLVGFTTLVLIGGLLHWCGERVPVLRDFGLPTLLCILLPPILLVVGLVPAGIAEITTTFTVDSGFLDFYVGSLIAGSILGMPRALLVKAGVRYAFPLVGTIVIVFTLVALLGAALGFGLREALFFVAAPVIGGGLGAGAVPMSEMYAASMGGTAGDYMTLLVPAVVVANTFAIVLAGVLGGLTRGGRQLFRGFNGNGNLVRAGAADMTRLQVPPRPTEAGFRILAVGLVVAGTLFVAGQLINSFVPAVHGYAWTILLAALLKIFDVLPEQVTDAVAGWYGFVAACLTPALLVGVGVAHVDLAQLGTLLTDPVYLGLTLMTVLVAALAAGAIGWLARLHFAETTVSVGLGMSDMGGTGDVAVVSAANRLELMPFLQISSRLGGALVLLVLSFLLPIL
ncbi:2-hydroxycarboxylate transporter family protein [Pseudonocardia nematodicida]|uniref:2-hydroxycarboxylate transporter family protein n=1 Tax=Pseudonocardia nematodicida TaxID=1206997 RepID=A0ABV1KHT6_9PSEU